MNKFFFILFTIIGLSIQPALADKSDGSVAPLVQSVFDSVVNISSTLKVKAGENTNALGSGFVYDATKGLIITNNHVVERSEKIEIYFHNGTKLPGKLIATDPKSDIALVQVKVDPKYPLSQITFGDSDNAVIGDKVLAIGNPFGLGGSVSLGIISAKHRSIDSGPYDDFIQTDAAINKGNSGGPLFDMAGHVIGMDTAIFSLQGGSLGIGFAIPSDTISYIVDQLQTHGKVIRGYMGVMTQEVNDDMAQVLGFTKKEGAIITKIYPGSPSEAADLKPGDVIISVNGQIIPDNSALSQIIAKTPVGTTVPIEIIRHGKTLTVQLKVAQLSDEDNAVAAHDEEETSPESLKNPVPDPEKGIVIQGLKVIDANDATREKYGHTGAASGALIINFILNSPADKIGLQVGDIITGVDGAPIGSAQSFKETLIQAAARQKTTVILQIENKAGEVFFMVLPVT